MRGECDTTHEQGAIMSTAGWHSMPWQGKGRHNEKVICDTLLHRMGRRSNPSSSISKRNQKIITYSIKLEIYALMS